MGLNDWKSWKRELDYLVLNDVIMMVGINYLLIDFLSEKCVVD